MPQCRHSEPQDDCLKHSVLLPDGGVKEVRKKGSITVSQYAVMLGGG